MALAKQQFKYYAIRVAGMIIFRRTATKLIRVRSRLYKEKGQIFMEQTSYTGGRVVATMPHTLWCKFYPALVDDKAAQISRDQYRQLGPYITKVVNKGVTNGR